ncbi:hypothetical protein CAEBREN_14293 [Caenorhabditis brenneri]|uniref:Uncharacterized protein n=1 Tax=Caenorhabditis brenneri TaxID=135651 RepID=G0NUD4_CAEBE|nr:hypothetical protein CAEBREN_14293 [Caenorhabditis brenneri]
MMLKYCNNCMKEPESAEGENVPEISREEEANINHDIYRITRFSDFL